MTQDELDRLEALANAATPGPWLYRGKSDSVHQAPWGPYQYGDQVFRFNDEEAPSDADCAFILAARDAVPALVAEVRRLQQDAARWVFIRDSGQLAVKAMRLLDGSHITEGYVGGPYADAAVDAMIAKEERRKALGEV